MNINSNEDLYIANISKKETYSAEEKNFILDRLNNERLQQQKADDESSNKTKQYTKKEKNDILEELNEERLRVQKRKEMKRKRLDNKEKYKFANKEYYKLKEMKREYYIEAESCEHFSGMPSIVTLYYLTFNELKKKDVLIKVQTHSEKFFISYDAIRVYFKPYALQNKHKKY